MSYVLFDGTNTVSLEPEYDIKFDRRKVENSHRTRSGENYRYRWGGYRRCKFSVEFLSSADMCQVNSWWDANVPLRLFDINSTVVVSGYLVNGSAPIDQYVKPYTDQFKGVIELEGY
mgnify:FL=1